MTEQQRATAITQLKRALGRQTNPLTLTMRGAAGMMNSPSMQRMRESAQQSMSAGGLLRSAVGIGSAARRRSTPKQTQREMEQAMAEPWVRGIGAARALAALGDAEAAARFYVACLQMLAERLGADGVPRGHHRLGPAPRRGAADLDARQRGRAVVVARRCRRSADSTSDDDERRRGGGAH